MPRKLTGRPTGRPPKYAWSEIITGEPRSLFMGRDFDCSPEAFQKQLQAELRRRSANGDPAARQLRTRRTPTTVELVPARTRVSAYPWSEWLNGETHYLTKGQHFTCHHVDFITQARRAARERGMTLRTRTRGNDYFREVAIKAYPKGTS